MEKKKEKKNKKRKYKYYAVLFVIIVIFCFWQNNHIVTSRYRYSSKDISKELEGYTIVQVSDLHNKQFGTKQKKLLARIESEKPDMIVVTGDLVDSNHTNVDKAMCFIEGAVKIAPVYYVTGNHENWLDEIVYQELMNRLQQAGVVCLDNETCTIEVGTETFTVIGLDDASLWGNLLNNLMKDIEEDKFTLLLAHEPQYLIDYSEAGVDLVFSGHAHGGQVRLPWIGGLVAPGQGILPEYTAGLYVEGNTSMYVSRGLGNSIIPVRIFNRPELLVITLNNEKFVQ